MSKKFQFRHQTLLEVGKQRERSAQIELSRALGAESSARERLACAQKLADEWDLRTRRSLLGQIEPRLLGELHQVTEALHGRMAKTREELRAASKLVEAAREKLQEASTARKSYERLRDRQYDEYASETSRQLVRISDEMSSIRAASGKKLGAEEAGSPEPAGERFAFSSSPNRPGAGFAVRRSNEAGVQG